ncbi:class I SAM-dependent methyltransferase [Sulfolobus sp. S-194]|uniref:class I SAM-dependent methyltransferase n=1 Tax=Sulfolobus sp. S-194 TaxID=2512240 RepID=UPI0014370B47|nr:class I SAM-dependent methyltransferase [Sulfolobus sp. S-194]QIW24839.1 class I SAM-dependent methyltransferase [Sulfolobus sp. S-194]
MSDIFRCPIDGSKFIKKWVCEKGHAFSEVDGIIDLLTEDIKSEKILDLIAPVYESVWAPLGLLITSGKSYSYIMRKAGEIVSGTIVLDIGTGTGKIFDYAKCEICMGLDISYKFLKILKSKRPNVIAVRGNALKLPFADESIDGISAMFVLHMFPSVLVAVREINRVLKHGKRCVATILTKNNMISQFLATIWGLRIHPADYYIKIFEEVGLKVDYEKIGAWTLFTCAKP